MGILFDIMFCIYYLHILLILSIVKRDEYLEQRDILVWPKKKTDETISAEYSIFLHPECQSELPRLCSEKRTTNRLDQKQNH